MVKNESIDNICVETSQPTRTARGSFWQNLKNYLPRSSGQAGTLTWCCRGGPESGADIAVLLVELDLSYGSLRSHIS